MSYKRMTCFFRWTFALILSGIGVVEAQNFSGYIALGSNVMNDKLTSSGTSQVGTRIGLNTGPGLMVKLNDRLSFGMELLYSQNGIYINPDQFLNVELERIRLHYLEVPLLLVLEPRYRNKLPGRITIKGAGGVSTARLFHSNVIPVEETALSEPITFPEPNAFLFHAGAIVSFHERYAVNVKSSVSTYGEWTFAFRFHYFLHASS
ncbi:MAG: outer membrane beta-barrel protein [Flavobacteriales bacterium]